jgi:LytS/YehU family sensor histidine kinase
VALAALGLLHEDLQPVRAVVCGGLGAAAALTLRPAWTALPPFVSRWLNTGVAVVAALTAAAATGLSLGPAYLVLRWQEVSLLGGAAGLLGVAVATLAYTHHRLATEVALQAARLAESQRLALESRLAALSAQINPHFLFNTLNTLAELIHEDEDRAEDLVTDLAAMMRYALESSAGRVPLTDELDVVRKLLRIEQARLGDRLRWTVEATGDLSDVLIPGLLVQPLVENAVRHAIATRLEGGRVDVTATRDGRTVRVVVADDGPGLPPSVSAALLDPASRPSGGTGGAGGGLRNTAERARLAWPDGRAHLSSEPAPTGTRLVLVLPAPEIS